MTSTIKKTAVGLALASAIALGSAPALAQSVGVVDLNAALANATALRTAETQIQAQYKTQIDAFNARRNAIAAELEPVGREIQALQANPATPPATLQARVAAYRTREQNAQRELQPLAAPFQRPLAYAQEQAAARLDQALRAAMVAKRVSVVVNPQAVIAIQPGADITADVTAQLNTLVQTVSVTPPAGWQPGQQQNAAAPAAGAAPAAAAPAGNRPRPRGR
jgi:Skp family chaperone for outer membrane proteins